MKSRNTSLTRSGGWLKAFLVTPFLFALLLAELGHRGMFSFELKREIRLGDITSAYTTVVLAFALQYGLARRNRETDARRELVTDHIEKVTEAADAIQPALMEAIRDLPPEPQRAASVLRAFDECQIQIGMLDSAIDHCTSTSLKSMCAALDETFLDCKASVTDEHPNRPYTSADAERAGRMRSNVVRQCQKIRLGLYEL